eukprot:TRINITY_DN9726_c0_g2_i1.p1 TRINITY_DN9726_c0_g2~~TRINITY_DN9726_c0_g2_i1.p1  ORF type:complete len:334 (-),score=72.47 TRINITY_DN9726_c0_g2_i1:9-1010(-)
MMLTAAGVNTGLPTVTPTLPTVTSPLLAPTLPLAPSTAVSPAVLAAIQAAKPALQLPILGTTPVTPPIPLPLVAGVPKLPVTATNSAATAANRIYIGSVPWDITENEIRTIFQPFGEIKSCSMMPNPETGKHKGFGFVEFDNKDAAEEAIKHMNGLILGGRAIKVGRAVTNASATSPGAAVPPINVALQNAAQVASSIASQLAQQKKDEDSLSKEENMTISGKDRYLVMQKLARGADMKTCRCIVLHNMVTIDDIDEELENEVSEECGKFGEVEKVVIYQEHQSDNPKDVIVKIYVIFKALESAHKAVSALNNRWFGGRIVRAELAHDTPFRI